MLFSCKSTIILAVVAITFATIGFAAGWTLHRMYVFRHYQPQHVSLQVLDAELLSHASAPNASKNAVTVGTANHETDMPRPIAGLNHPPREMTYRTSFRTRNIYRSKSPRT